MQALLWKIFTKKAKNGVFVKKNGQKYNQKNLPRADRKMGGGWDGQRFWSA